jgi:transcriptional regulator with XRE-family HTH domain
MERGERNISLRNIERIACVLGVTMAELLADDRHERDGTEGAVRIEGNDGQGKALTQ